MVNALLYYLIVINILTFAVYGIDKWRSTSDSVGSDCPHVFDKRQIEIP